ncbi:thiol peroxidase [Gracilinema caldarium]|uniref:thiol peroxidase n=1 Tax=Gracilinema caldarium TaxID=215591 RepID=UPI0026F22EC1|nr:thiol peroxidase [Gracilinema caldarium]
MAHITFKGSPISTQGSLPAVGSKAPDFRLVDAGLADRRLADYSQKIKILNIVPSLDTSVCALSAKKFDAEVAKLANVVVLNISCDLPFAASRFCKTEGVNNVVTLSQMRDRSFGKDYGVEILDGPLAGLLSRAVVVLDGSNTVRYTEQVPEIAQEPDYTKALATAKALL